MVTTLTSIFLILTIIFGGSGVTAYAAQNSQPNEALYSVKLLTEDLQFKLTNNERTRAEIELQFLEKRFSELAFLLENQIPIPETYVLRLQEQMQTMTHLAAQQADEEAQQLLLRYQEMLRTQARIFEAPANTTPDPDQIQLKQQIMDQIRMRLEECETGLQDAALLRQRLMQSGNGNAEPQSLEPSDQPNDGQNQNQLGPGGQDDPGKQYQGPVDDKGQQSENSFGPGPEAGPGSEECPNADQCNEVEAGPGPGSGPGPNESPGSDDCLNQENCKDYDYGPGPEAGPGPAAGSGQESEPSPGPNNQSGQDSSGSGGSGSGDDSGGNGGGKGGK